MPVLGLALLRLYRSLAYGLRDEQTRGLISITLMTVLIGTLFYHWNEGWSLIDSLYFTVITLTTIGYGDLTPTTDASKLFTLIYVVLGLGLISNFIVVIGRLQRQMREGGDTTGNDT